MILKPQIAGESSAIEFLPSHRLKAGLLTHFSILRSVQGFQLEAQGVE